MKTGIQIFVTLSKAKDLALGIRIMWLLKNEKKLFLYYAKRAKKAGEVCEVSDKELLELLKLHNVEELHELKSSLKKRDLITFTTFEPDTHILNVNSKDVPVTSKNPRIRLKESGEELANKYSTCFGKLELLCKSYMWFLVLLSVIISLVGVIVTTLISALKD